MSKPWAEYPQPEFRWKQISDTLQVLQQKWCVYPEMNSSMHLEWREIPWCEKDAPDREAAKEEVTA